VARKFGYEKRFLDYPYHCFPDDVEARRKVAAIYLELMPDITFVQTPRDHWPDHVNTGRVTKDAVLFSHGYSDNRSIRRCPRVLAYNVSPVQSDGFAPDYFVDVSDVVEPYMELITHSDGYLSNRPPEQTITREVRHTSTGQTLRLSEHGWGRIIELARWGQMNHMQYAIGLETLWGPRDGRPLW
jgi:LmbE family N-acetylglucosaminyl deacetylase